MQILIAVAALLGAATAAPLIATRASTEPCALVSQALASNEDAQIDADVAYQCLQSVPLDTASAALQMEGIKTMTQFQSK